MLGMMRIPILLLGVMRILTKAITATTDMKKVMIQAPQLLSQQRLQGKLWPWRGQGDLVILFIQPSFLTATGGYHGAKNNSLKTPTTSLTF